MGAVGSGPASDGSHVDSGNSGSGDVHSQPLDLAGALTSRLAGVDALRLLALMAIVVGHVYVDNEWVDRSLQSWRLPLFFVITGYFWSSRRNVRQEVDKRSRSLLVPYACWLLLLTLGLMILRFGDWHLTGWARTIALGGSYAGRPWTTMWFFTALFFAAVAFRFLQKFGPTVRWCVIIAGLGLNIWAGPSLAKIPWSLGTAAGAIAFIALGSEIRQLQRHHSKLVRPAVGVTLLIVSAAIAILVPGDFEPVDMKSGQFPAPAVLLAALFSSALIILVTAIRWIPPGAGRWLSAAALPSAVVIALHPFVLTMFPPATLTDGQRVLVTVAAFVVPLLIGILIVRTPLSPLLAGVPRERRSA